MQTPFRPSLGVIKIYSLPLRIYLLNTKHKLKYMNFPLVHRDVIQQITIIAFMAFYEHMNINITKLGVLL